MGNYFSLGDRGFAPFQGGTNVFSYADTLDMIRGKHDIRVGIGTRFNQMNVETNGFQDGFFIAFGLTGDNTADLLLGQLGGGIHDQTFLGATTGRRWKMFRPFVQDDWRVTPSLTLNLGLAWALVTPITEARNRQANFDFSSGKFYVAGSTVVSDCPYCVRSDSRVGIEMDKTAFEPRIGLAWKPFGSQTTAVRAGYAIYHDSAWSQGAQERPFLTASIKTDTPEALEKAQEASEDYLKKPGQRPPVTYLLEMTPRFPSPAWRVLWGQSAGTAERQVFVDASTGAVLGKE